MRDNKSILFLILTLILVFTLPVLADEPGRVHIGSDQYIPAGNKVNGDAVVIFGDQQIDGDVFGSVVTIFGDVEVKGNITEDLVSVFGKVIVRDGAQVRGEVVSVLGDVERQGKNNISGEIVSVGPGNISTRFINDIPIRNYGFHYPRFNFPFGKFIISMVLTLLLIHFFQPYLENTYRVLQDDPVRIGAIGLVAFLVVSLSAIIFAITILGIPAAIILGIALQLATLFGKVSIYLLIGERIDDNVDWELNEYSKGIAGAFIIWLVSLVPLGGLVEMLIGWLGLGAVIKTKFGTHKNWIK